MKPDIEYWQTDKGITVEPRTSQGRTALVEEFPLYQAGKTFNVYVAGTGLWRWEFPVGFSGLEGWSELNVFVREKIDS